MLWLEPHLFTYFCGASGYLPWLSCGGNRTTASSVGRRSGDPPKTSPNVVPINLRSLGGDQVGPACPISKGAALCQHPCRPYLCRGLVNLGEPCDLVRRGGKPIERWIHARRWLTVLGAVSTTRHTLLQLNQPILRQQELSIFPFLLFNSFTFKLCPTVVSFPSHLSFTPFPPSFYSSQYCQPVLTSTFSTSLYCQPVLAARR